MPNGRNVAVGEPRKNTDAICQGASDEQFIVGQVDEDAVGEIQAGGGTFDDANWRYVSVRRAGKNPDRVIVLT